jgi:hypothetical protein
MESEPLPPQDPEPRARDSRRKKQWSDLSPNARTAIVVGGIVELIMTTLALRDLARRPSSEVRGWKPIWVLLFFVQPFGPLLYFARGRRRPAA